MGRGSQLPLGFILLWLQIFAYINKVSNAKSLYVTIRGDGTEVDRILSSGSSRYGKSLWRHIMKAILCTQHHLREHPTFIYSIRKKITEKKRSPRILFSFVVVVVWKLFLVSGFPTYVFRISGRLCLSFLCGDCQMPTCYLHLPFSLGFLIPPFLITSISS